VEVGVRLDGEELAKGADSVAAVSEQIELIRSGDVTQFARQFRANQPIPGLLLEVALD
jgi:hypothetical protein